MNRRRPNNSSQLLRNQNRTTRLRPTEHEQPQLIGSRPILSPVFAARPNQQITRVPINSELQEPQLSGVIRPIENQQPEIAPVNNQRPANNNNLPEQQQLAVDEAIAQQQSEELGEVNNLQANRPNLPQRESPQQNSPSSAFRGRRPFIARFPTTTNRPERLPTTTSRPEEEHFSDSEEETEFDQNDYDDSSDEENAEDNDVDQNPSAPTNLFESEEDERNLDAKQHQKHPVNSIRHSSSTNSTRPKNSPHDYGFPNVSSTDPLENSDDDSALNHNNDSIDAVENEENPLPIGHSDGYPHHIPSVKDNDVMPIIATPSDVVKESDGCPAKFMCVPEEYCNIAGVVVDTPVSFPQLWQKFRIPLTVK